MADISGEELEELRDIRGLKTCLNQLHGFPPRFRQRLLHHGESLEETAILAFSMDLDLVVLPFADLSGSPMDDLAIAASAGRLARSR